MNENAYVIQIEKMAATEIKEESLPKRVKDSIVEMKINDTKKNVVKYTGAALGTGIALKRGQPLGKALLNGGLGGMAIGDIAGGAIIPTMSLYKKHKEEFGTTPDIKTTGKLLAANVAPSALFWGGLYGTKAGLKYRGNIASGLENNINKVKSKGAGVKKVIDDVTEFYGRPENLAEAQNFSRVNQRLNDGVKEVLLGDMGNLGRDAIKKKVLKGAVGAAIPGLVLESLNLPAAYATPTNLINAKKRRLEQGEK